MKPALFGTLALLLLGAAPLHATEHEVLMLNYGADGGMVFEPAFLRVEPGDSVIFVPENSGHYVESFAVPDGAAPWKSALDERFTVTLDTEGVYLYVCPPHLMMSMLGAIQVGKATNIEVVREKALKLKPRLVMNGGRLDAVLAQATTD